MNCFICWKVLRRETISEIRSPGRVRNRGHHVGVDRRGMDAGVGIVPVFVGQQYGGEMKTPPGDQHPGGVVTLRASC